MAEILKFICFMIIFLSSFIVSESLNGHGRNRCFRDSDCPKVMCPSYLVTKCFKKHCRCRKPGLQVQLNPK
ncbi:Nodule Cysteine-Rich (NCR) secreted peptide [Medicago truncatula]|uniref:Nodule Cysteine-Rich (NCR) secreted peptide n=1 Tax=Medicago truncatula TaxID=3880 RepID=G7IWA4_MEDTR|nr:Nodule Cysteine-Rich (NCR) secreted peptide [Medicago truncatula]